MFDHKDFLHLKKINIIFIKISSRFPNVAFDLFTVIYTYMWLVVYSHFQELKIEKLNKRMGPYGKPYNYRRP